MKFKQRSWVWKVNIFGKHVKAGQGSRDPFDHKRVQKIAKELARQQKLEAKASQNNSYNF